MRVITTRESSEALKQEYIARVDKIEREIIKYRESLYRGELKVDDIAYDNILEYLRLLKPDSPLVQTEREIIEVKEVSNGILREMERLVGKEAYEVPFIMNVKGMNVKITYEKGELVRAVTYGRSYGGVDVTYKIKKALGSSNSYLEIYDKIELTGKLVMSTRDLEMLQEQIDVKTAYEAVFKVIMDELVEELELYDVLHFMAIDLKMEGDEVLSIQEKYENLESLGYIIPELSVEIVGTNIIQTMGDALYYYDTEFMGYPYETDGVRMYVPGGEIVLIKAGKWGNPTHVGTIDRVDWKIEYGRYIAEVILLDEDQTRIELRDVSLLIMLSIERGNDLRYVRIGELGLVPVTNKDEMVLSL